MYAMLFYDILHYIALYYIIFQILLMVRCETTQHEIQYNIKAYKLKITVIRCRVQHIRMKPAAKLFPVANQTLLETHCHEYSNLSTEVRIPFIIGNAAVKIRK